MKSIFNVLFILLCINSGCNQETKSKNHSLDFFGEWMLDNDSYSAINRGCVSVDFDDSQAMFKISKHKDNYLIRFNNATNTTWQSPLNRKSINARQILNTSYMGKFCGEQTEVRLTLRFDPKSRNKIIGKLEVPTCRECPVVEFIADRIPNNK